MSTETETNPKRVKLRGRLSYPHLFKPKGFAGQAGSEKYSAVFILDKKENAEDIKKVQEAIDFAVKEKWGQKGKAPPADKLCLKDGGSGENATKPGYGPGVMFINASNADRPGVYDQKVKTLAAEDNAIKAGDYVVGVVTVWAQDNQYGKRVNASLELVQLRKEGEALGREALRGEDVLDEIQDDDEQI